MRHEEMARRGGRVTPTSRLIAEGTAVALGYKGLTYFVMKATPADLDDFGIGFGLTEGIVKHANEIESIDLIETEHGIEMGMWLARTSGRLAPRRRPIVCGLDLDVHVLS